MNPFLFTALFLIPGFIMAQDSDDLDRQISQALNANPDTTIEEGLSKLREQGNGQREDILREMLMKVGFAYNKKKYPSPENKQRLSRALIDIYQAKDVSDSEKDSILRALTQFGENQIAKPFVLRLLTSDEKARAEIFRALGGQGGISGPEIYDAVKELADKGLVGREGRTTMLARADKDRALKEILTELETTQVKEQFVYSAWVLQDYYRKADYYKFIVPGLLKFGLISDGIVMNKSFKGGSGIGWVNADLFSEYVEKLPPNEALVAFEIMTKETQLCKPSTVPMLIRMMKRGDPAIRLMAAKGLRRASEFSLSDAIAIKSSLRAGFDSETDAQVKAAIDAELKTMERHEKAWNEMLKRTGQK